VSVAILRLDEILTLLRRYKYVWLTTGLLLTALTIFFGTNPAGVGPRLWLGCCGIYLQPSEPLKLLLIIFLAAYLADRQFLIQNSAQSSPSPKNFSQMMALLAPTLLMVGLATGIVMVQRDLGTASILLGLYAGMVYMASGDRWVVLLGLGGLVFAALVGYFLYDVVQLRLEAWINPWADPSGGSYQIIQSLIGIANGGLLGRGPGLGSPGLVPVVHSDFIFVSIAEENGLAGALVFLFAIGALASRSLLHAFHSGRMFRRMLEAGLAIYIGGQSILIIGGNLRLLPLTGVTLPFVSYGGSSLVVSFIALALLLRLSAEAPVPLPAEVNRTAYRTVGLGLGAGLVAAALLMTWWALFRSEDLLARTDNARRAVAERFVQRGSVVDRENRAITESTGSSGSYTRITHYPQLGPVIGYTSPLFGQAGIEAAADDFLRGLAGYPFLYTAWHQFLYGQPPPGLDVRLSIDVRLQAMLDEALAGKKGAAVLMNAENGELLALSSLPGFDPNQLDQDWETYRTDSDAPLLNRTVQGQYPAAAALGPMLYAELVTSGRIPDLPATLNYEFGDQTYPCALEDFAPATFGEALTLGCPGAVARLGELLGEEGLAMALDGYGVFRIPSIGLPASASEAVTSFAEPGAAALGLFSEDEDSAELWLSPLNMALAAAPVSAGGYQPVPRLILAHRDPQGGWALTMGVGEGQQLLPASAAKATAEALADPAMAAWHITTSLPGNSAQGAGITWFVGGSREPWQGSPVVLVIAIEENDPIFVNQVGREILAEILGN
jgi:cell division protein FtsW (lipid II flippase)